MTSWDDQFEKHPVHGVLAQLRTAHQSANRVVAEQKITDSTVVDGLVRVSAQLEWVEASLAQADRLLAAQNLLRAIQNSAQNALNELNNFIANRNAGNVSNAVNQLDGAVSTASQLPVPRSVKDLEAVAKGSSEFRTSIGRLHGELSTLIGKSKERLDVLQVQIDAAKTEVQNQKTRLDTALNGLQKTFTDAQDKRREEATKMNSEFQETFQAKEKERAEQHTRQLNEVSKTTKDTLRDLTAMKEQAEKLVQAIGSAGMTTGYQGEANRMGRHALWWQLGSVGAVGAFVLFGVLYVLPHVNGDSPWTLVLVRVFMSFPLLFLAGFCVTQVRHFHRLEESHRSMELQLASLDPFVATLPESNKLAIKEQAVPRFFPGNNSSPSKQNPVEAKK